MGSTLEGLTRHDDPGSRGVIRQRRWLYRVVLAFMVLLLGSVVLDGLDVFEVVGPDEAVVRVDDPDYVLEVEHPSTTRPALASVFRITVSHEGGFVEPIQIGITRRYLEMWDVNGTLPSPSGETAVGEWIIWEFDPPPGDELVITYEARIEPGVQSGTDGRVAIFEDDQPSLIADFRTEVRP